MPSPMPRVPPVTSAARLAMSKECQVRRPLCEPFDVQRCLARVVIAPLARFAPWNLRSRRHVIPAVRTVIDRMHHESLMPIVSAQVRLGKERLEDSQARLLVTIGVSRLTSARQNM